MELCTTIFTELGLRWHIFLAVESTKLVSWCSHHGPTSPFQCGDTLQLPSLPAAAYKSLTEHTLWAISLTNYHCDATVFAEVVV